MARLEKFQEQLLPKWRDALVGGELSARIETARAELSKAVESARGILDKNPLTVPAAAAAAKELNKPGLATITVDEAGCFWIVLDLKARGGNKRGWSTNLPSLPALRAEAGSLGVDIKPLGRNKGLLLKAIENAKRTAIDQAESKLPDGAPRRRMVKTGIAVQPPVILTQVPSESKEPN